MDAGIDHYDTAASYQLGDNEKFVGATLAPLRQRLFIATKCGLARKPDGGTLVDNRPATIRAPATPASRRLGTDYIDLFYLHRVDRTVPIEESTGALAELVQAGKIRHAGLSECSEQTLRRACKVLPIAAVQSEYSIWSRDPEGGVLAACEELGVTFVSYSPLGRGFLAGNFRNAGELPEGDARRKPPAFPAAGRRQQCAAGRGNRRHRRGARRHWRPGRHRLGAVTLATGSHHPRHEDPCAPAGQPRRSAAAIDGKRTGWR